ncbi:complex I NDUFA5 subunit family protein [Aspergillus saccharolyticus JOP 1030-1]|uniref:Putative NADH-ubiquinone oxidoreductase 299 kDa subunit n=1 Tax=Aspergillus saccharolyticus JOP 1030-1 TaxID=1450539 RepID=A0A318ZIZ3_9EURO|nr:putative NADH-ubiquinone oxidoreductase 299 kDa subunit [Aspergillus saccharolyticus JOP 1030-1]PYH47541.1 putative NADH-ubiquinone oxidoreductase 299 kDa subunit [Aspergillus saccharolyticus JOP 1030-1]
MRSTFRLLANVKPARYLEPFAPTGLTGLNTHPSPRSTLIFLYTSTLNKLKSFPESSVYRQSTEALTRQRLQIVESTKPPGFEAWLERVKKTVGAEPERFSSLLRGDGTYAAAEQPDGSDNARGEEWDGEAIEATTEGPARTPEEEARFAQLMEESASPRNNESDFHVEEKKWEAEPALTAEQISEIEKQIGAGLIEEVIQVAEGELKVVDELYKSKAWEELEEKPRPGQWSYFERPE